MVILFVPTVNYRQPAAKGHQLTNMSRIGIYSGTFNPVHSGHLSFALQAIAEARLDRVYLMPERHHRAKTDVTHYGHRVAMIRRAILPHPQLGLLESVDISLSVDRTLPRLKAHYPGDQLVFLCGSDVVTKMGSWPNVNRLLEESELVVGIREGEKLTKEQLNKQLPVQPRQLLMIDSFAPHISSTSIRSALRERREVAGILASVRRYSDHNWLYISLT